MLIAHVNKPVNPCYYQLRRIKSCRRSSPVDAVKTIVDSFVVSRIDFCNALPSGSPASTINKLQRVSNPAVKLFHGGKKYDRVTNSCETNYTGCVYRREWRHSRCVCLLSKQCNLAPQYVADFCIPVASIAARNSLRSATAGHHVVPRTRTKFGEGSVAVAGTSAWNKLPQNIRQADCIATFKRLLKIHFLSAWRHLMLAYCSICNVGNK